MARLIRHFRHYAIFAGFAAIIDAILIDYFCSSLFQYFR